MSEIENASYPSIDPSFFDLIVVGTGLPESILAAAASASSPTKSVLHLDSNPFYGSHFSSLSLDDFTSFLQSQRNIPLTPTEYPPTSFQSDAEYLTIYLKPRRLYTHIDISFFQPSETLGPSRSFALDLSGPRVLFCADPMVDLMLKSKASHHLEFKSVDATLLFCDGRFLPVPDSRAAIFKDRTLGLMEKSQLMSFFKLSQEHFGPSHAGGSDEEKRISEEDFESPFIDFLNKQQLPPKIKSIILYAIAMAEYDQDSLEGCKNLVKTKDGMKSLALYSSSVGRFPNALGAFIYPIYGQGELPQAFCRCAAVKGALYVLRMPVTALLLDKENRNYKGVKLESGQNLFSQQLTIDPSFVVPPTMPSPLSSLHNEGFEPLSPGKVISSPITKVARGVCITRGSIRPELSNLLIVFPPRSLYAKQLTSIRALQLGSTLVVCPPNLFVLYLSTLCDDAIQGKESLHAAMNSLFILPLSNNSENSSLVQNEVVERETKPTLLWRAIYIQELTEFSSDTVSSCPMPDGNLDYRDLLESMMKVFHNMYPEEEIFPEAQASENTEDEDGSLD